MRRFVLGGMVACLTIALGHAGSTPAAAQGAPLVVIEAGSGCAPALPTSCRVFLVNRNTSSRAVANVERKQVSNFPPTMYDRNLYRISQGDTQFEVLLSAGDRVPLVPAVAVVDPGPGAGLFVRYEYRVLGSHEPTADDIADAGSPNVADYFRLVVVHMPAFDNTDACRIGAIAHPMKGLRIANFHPTKTIVVTHRNSAPRYGPNPTPKVDYIPPGGVASVPAVGCESDIGPGYIEIRDVRFQ